MSNLYECIIRFKPSKDYRRLMLIIHSMALLFLMMSGLWILIKGLLGLLLIKQMWGIYLKPIPYSNILKLKIKPNQCCLLQNPHAVYHFDHYRITLEVGLFFLLELSANKKKKRMIIFYDQMEKGQFWQMRVLEKMQT